MGHYDDYAFMERSSKWGYHTPLIDSVEAITDGNVSEVIDDYLEENCRSVKRFKSNDWEEVESLKKLRIFIEYFMKIQRGIPEFNLYWEKNKSQLKDFTFLYDQQAHIESLQNHYSEKDAKDPRIAATFLVDCISRLFSNLSEDLLLSILSFLPLKATSFKLGEQLDLVDGIESISLLRSKRTGKLFVKNPRKSFHIRSVEVWEAIKKLYTCSSISVDIFSFGSITYLSKSHTVSSNATEWLKMKDGDSEFKTCEQPAQGVFNDCLIDIEQDELFIRTPDQQLKLPLHMTDYGFKGTPKIGFERAGFCGIFITVNGSSYHICFQVRGKAKPVPFPEALCCEIEKPILLKRKCLDAENKLPGGLRAYFEASMTETDICLGRSFYIEDSTGMTAFSMEESCDESEDPKINVAVLSDDGSLVIGFEEFLAELIPKKVTF